MISLCHSRLPSGISIPLQRRWTIVFCDYTDNMSFARVFKPAFESRMPRIDRRLVATACAWLERIDPGAHRRVKGLRLVTAYALAAMTATLADITRGAQTAQLCRLLREVSHYGRAYRRGAPRGSSHLGI